MRNVECSQVKVLTDNELELVNGGGIFGSIGRSVRSAYGKGGCGGTAKSFHDAFSKGGSNSGRGRDYSGGCGSSSRRRGGRRD